MELRQLRYFVSVIEHGSMGRAALALGIGTSALSQQMTKLESELSTRLLRRTRNGVMPTDAGIAFWRQAQLAVRHADHAVVAAQHARLAGHVAIGFPPSTASVVGVPFIRAMSMRYPEVRLRVVESLSGYLATMLGARQLDLAVLFSEDSGQRWSFQPLLEERLFLIGATTLPGMPSTQNVSLEELGQLPLLVPSQSHGLRSLITSCFDKSRNAPNIIGEIDGLALLMAAVRDGIGATIQPGSALGSNTAGVLRGALITDYGASRSNFLASLSEDELSPAALAARVVLRDVARSLVLDGQWPGANLPEDGLAA